MSSWSASTSVSFVRTLPAAEASPVKAVLPGFTPLSVTGSPELESANASGASFVPAMVMTRLALEVASCSSVTV